MGKKAATSEVIQLRNVRLSFARLFEAKAFRVGQTPRYEATFLLDPSNADHAATIKLLQTTAGQLIQQQWDGTKPATLALCMGKGDTKGYDGYAGMIYVASHNKVRPTVVDRNRNPVAEGDTQAPYSGCYVNATITLWAQDNEFGKRINANLRGVQFVRAGEAFGIQPVDATEEFEQLEGDAAAPTAGGVEFN